MIITNVEGNYFLKQNDTATDILLAVSESDGGVIDLTAASHVEVVIGRLQGRMLVKIPTSINALGEFTFGLDEGDVLPVGDNLLEVHIYDSNGEKRVAPSKGHYKLKVQRAIDTIGDEITTYTLDYFLGEVNRITYGLPDLIVRAEGLSDEMDVIIEQSKDLVQDSTLALAQSQAAKQAAESALATSVHLVDSAGTNAIRAENASIAAEQATISSIDATSNTVAATSSANNAAAAATSAANAANTATSNADNATTAATNATAGTLAAKSDAEQATLNANDAATSANAASGTATLAATNAINATNDAVLATEDAILATTGALSAKTQAETATSNAINATSDANQATSNANNATSDATLATSNASTQATYAKEQGDYAKTEATSLATLKSEVQTATTNADNASANAITAANAAVDATQQTMIAKDSTVLAVQQANDARDSANVAASLADGITTNLQGLDKVIEDFSLAKTFIKHQPARFNGSTYRAKKETQGNPLPVAPALENEWWTLEAQRGVDGEGAVASVNGVMPDINGNVEVPIPSTEWDNIPNKPTEFTPSSHSHDVSDIVDLQLALDGKVPKVVGKDLSEDNYTTVEKSKLANIEEEANKTVVNDTLTSDSVTEVLSAARGKELAESKADNSDLENLQTTVNEHFGKAASELALGHVKPDGVTITVDANGVISGANTYVLPTASETVLGGIKVDGETILIDGNGVISAVGGGGEGISMPDVTDLVATSSSDGKTVNVSWVNPSNVELIRTEVYASQTDITNYTIDTISSVAQKVVNDNTTLTYTQTANHNERWYFKTFTVHELFGERYSSGLSTNTTAKDTIPPNAIFNFIAAAGNAEINLSWINPSDSDFEKVIIRYSMAAQPLTTTDGLLAYEGSSNSVKLQSLVNGTQYYFRAFTVDLNGNVNDTAVGQQVEATPQSSVIYGVKIDTTNSNPETAVTYTDSAIGLTPASGNNGAFSYGSWQDKFPFNEIYPCIVKDGVESYKLNPNNYAQKLDGSAADITSGNDGDVMVRFPKIWWKFETIGNDLYVRYVNAQVDSGYKALADTKGTAELDEIFVSAYLGFETGGKLRSLNGKTPTANKTIGAFRTIAQANGASYDQMLNYPTLMLQVMYLVMFKSRDSQTALGHGYVDGNSAATITGGANAKGLFYGESTGKQQMKFCGIEDWYGNVFYWLDGLVTDANRNILIGTQDFNDVGTGYANLGQGATANLSGYISDVQGGTETGFIVKATSGSETTHYADFGDLLDSRVARFGGYWTDASSAGAFYLRLSRAASIAAANIGARLLCR